MRCTVEEDHPWFEAWESCIGVEAGGTERIEWRKAREYALVDSFRVACV